LLLVSSGSPGIVDGVRCICTTGYGGGTNVAVDDDYETFRALLSAFTPADAIKRLESFGVPPSKVEEIHARHEHERLLIRELEEPRTVVNGNRDTWYTGPQARDRRWPAVEWILRKSGWGDDGISSLDEASTRIVSLLNHPKETKFQTRGLVVGYVQSGKTTNFTSVIAKAADRGYKLIIVLSGIHNGLRRQTQARLEKQLVEPNKTLWHLLTKPDQDFVPPANPAAYFGKQADVGVLCVVKKNATVLKKLVEWLEKASQYLEDCPTLIVDDEADQATVATKTINPLILRLMESLPRSVYLGYTATPFANLLIDPSAEDLYPKDFVVNLPKPVGHFGTEVLFGRDPVGNEALDQASDGYDMIRTVPDEDVPWVRPMKKADREGFTPEITPTLREAVEYFWLATAARRVRGTGNPHSTMLIHTSVNTAVHNSFREPLEHLRSRAKGLLADSIYREHLRSLWEEEGKRVPAGMFGEQPVDFEDLAGRLPGVLAACRIVMDNSQSEDRLDYEGEPVVAIAVGGNTLSRGLTLEGLNVSYFVRAVSAYDTLLQMGRWFGFRDGYGDLPRIWMTDELAGWFRHLATVEHEMRADIDRYMSEAETPMTFAVRLRTHPALLVTARAKMKDAVTAAAAYGGRRVQTHYFHNNAEWLRVNADAARSLVAAASKYHVRYEAEGTSRHTFHGVSHESILEFLRSYQFHEDWAEATPELLSNYIEKRIDVAGALRSWNVAVVGNELGAGERFSFADDVTVGTIVRARLKSHEEADGAGVAPETVDIKTLMSPRDIAVDLEGDLKGLKESGYVDARQEQLPDTGLLVLYPIDKNSRPSQARKATRARLGTEEHVIGAAFVFPKPKGKDSEAIYIQADLPKYDVEDEDLSVLEADVA
jgi:hypothetical protein